MRSLLWVGLVLTAVLGGVSASSSDALSSDRYGHYGRIPHFVPNSQRFWDNSKNWTTNYGPAYRNVIEAAENFVPCTGSYALCFSSGPEPLPCRIDRSGRFAECTCTVEDGLNFVDINAILNYKVYLETIEVCGTMGEDCVGKPDKAPVCEAIRRGELIPPARLYSTFSEATQSSLVSVLAGAPPVTECPKGPYAGCMTAPCRQTRSGDAQCSCPVFYGPYQLTSEGAQCDLGGRLVNSASYTVLPSAQP